MRRTTKNKQVSHLNVEIRNEILPNKAVDS